MPDTGRIHRILHPTDLGAGSAVAFLHALRIATITRSVLTILHVDKGDSAEWVDLPGVRSTLAGWGMLRDAGDMEGLMAMGVGVHKVLHEGSNPVRACLDHLGEHPTDLIVLSTHQEGGRVRWFGRQVAEPLARGAGEPTLFIPDGEKGFVDAATGKVEMNRILVPVAMRPDPRRALEMAMRLAERLDLERIVFTLLHVGDTSTDPIIELPERTGWSFERIVRQGDPVGTIMHVAEATRADLVLMTTKGHDGFLDALRGSTTERVMRAVKCPVLAVPA
jgi:nucleotide-binding universal stress UspA family protein